MRVAEIAELTGTTVRTVRYYHSLGILPIPSLRGGWRDYELSHVARLSRIRWLVQAGVPLAAVARILDANDDTANDDAVNPDESQVVADLGAALAAVEKHLAEVTSQRDMLRELLARAEAGVAASPMPPRMVVFFDRIERAASDEQTLASVRRERDLVDLACYRGQMPPEAELLFPDPDEQGDREALFAYSLDINGLSVSEVEQHAATIVARFERQLGPQRARELAQTADISAIHSLFRLVASIDPYYERIGPAVERHLVAGIERWREG